MIRFHENRAYLTECEDLINKSLTLDCSIWQKGRKYFVKQNESDIIPVLDSKGQLSCFAWQDEEANREIRMLRELQERSDYISFCDLHPDCVCVTIHGCNELAWYMRDYLVKNGIEVNVEGKFWNELGIQSKECSIPEYQNYDIWAEGVHQKSDDWKQERLRSASVEFECIDEIYEANIKAGKITDSSMDVEVLLEKLRQEKEIVVRGTGTKAQDVYDWLLGNGITVCAFQAVREQEGRKMLFGKPVLKKEEIEKIYERAIFLEGAATRSAWGFGEVDTYDYEGYERNKRYFLVRDYIEVPENNLMHVFNEEKLVVTGDIRLCSRLYKWYIQHGMEQERIYYLDLLGNAEKKRFQLSVINRAQLGTNNTVMLVLPGHSYRSDYLTKAEVSRRDVYFEKFAECGIIDWSDYFSDLMKCIHLETETLKFHKKELCPAGILIGAIPEFCGNVLIRQCLSGHSQIAMIEDYSAFNSELYYFCIRLAEESANDILSVFWTLYHEEIQEDEDVFSAFAGKDTEKFNKKMKELLAIGEYFSSQELFVMFHLAYMAMYDNEVLNLKNTIIYWEPHWWNREYVREWAYWVKSGEIKNYILNVVRNSHSRSGSCLRSLSTYSWEKKKYAHIFWKYKRKKAILDIESEYTIKFEELKSKPQDEFIQICEWLGIRFENSLLETTIHGKTASYGSYGGMVTGFDMKPVYNLYEEFFSAFDRMRIYLINASFQKKFGYPYVRCMDFSRRELQEMFLQDFRWELPIGATEGRTRERVFLTQKYTRKRLWLERYAEVMGVDAYED